MNLSFQVSPGGVAEVEPEWVARHHCHVRIVDVREASELDRGGHIAHAEWVPMDQIPEAATEWSPREPVVFVCRSGRRSARAVQLVEAMGVTTAASMTGGMLRWEDHDLPIERTLTPEVEHELRVEAAAISEEDVHARLSRTPVRWMRAAALLLHGTEACVDGREPHAVVGTPGGDAGELLLALSTIEAETGRVLSEDDVAAIFDSYVHGFGRFYMHTDDHAVEHLKEELIGDPRFADVPLETIEQVEALFRRPPVPLREPLLEHLVAADNVGCGHLKLILRHPDQYAVRAPLTRSLLRVAFRRLWQEPEMVDYVILHGEHEEQAVVNVHLDDEVHPFTNVPAIAPQLEGRSVFVNHPEVSAFVRAQHARFLFGHLDWLAEEGLTRERFEQALAGQANRQLEATVGHLAARLPVVNVHVDEQGHLVETPTVPVAAR